MKTTCHLFLLIFFLLFYSVAVSADTTFTLEEKASVQNEDIGPSPVSEPVVDTEAEEAESTQGDDIEDIDEEKAAETLQIADPLHPWNKAMFHVNDKLYFWFLKPVAQGYSAVVPEDIRLSVRNVFNHIATPVRFVSSLLQFKAKDAGNELVRFFYNSTVGVFGLVDAAKTDLGIRKKDEDLGQTLGTYGIGHGFYVVWPFLGPSSLRDSIGKVGDRMLSPTNYLNPTETSVGITVYDRVNETSLRIGDYEDLKKSAVDPYLSLRDAYLQYRKKKVED